MKRFSKRTALTAITAAALAVSAFATGITASAAPAQLGAAVQKTGKYEKWIDRINVPSYLSGFYSSLEEAADGDRNADWLIDYTKAQRLNDGSYVICLREISGTAASETAMKNAVNSKCGDTADNAAAIFSAFERDHPETFWLNGQTCTAYGYSWTCSGGVYTYNAKVNFIIKSSDFSIFCDEYPTATRIYGEISSLNSRISTILKNAPSGADTVKLVTYFNDTITKSNEYNTRSNTSLIPSASHTCVAALKGSYGTNGPVCEGYSKAFKVLCDRAGIPCFITDGVSGSSTHMWNNVKVDGKWYAVDVTWNDPIVSGRSGVVSGYEGNNYTLVGTGTTVDGKKFSDTHIIKNAYGPAEKLFLNQPDISSAKYTAPNYAPGSVAVSQDFTATTSAVRINWSKASNATGYRIYVYNESTATWSTAATVTSSGTLTYKFTGLKAGNTYKYKIKAYRNYNGSTYWSGYSDVITTAAKPAKPGISKVSVSKSAVRPYWNKVNGATGYKLQQYKSGKWVTVYTGSASDYKAASLKSKTTYNFRIQAYKKINGKTLYSDWNTFSGKTA